MFDKINQQMTEAQRGMYRLQQIDAMLKELREERQAIESKASDLKTILDQEDKDVMRLENKSLTQLFYSFLGHLDEKLEKERGEVLAAKLKYEQAVSELNNLNEEINKLLLEKENYLGCAKAYHKLYEQKKELLLESTPQVADKIIALNDNIQKARYNIKEIDEAISVGSQVIIQLHNTLSSLESASGWATWDLLGGGLIADMAKHGHIDSAKSSAEVVQRLLSRFRSELADIRINSQIKFEISSFAKFADYFFDGLLADWHMKSKISESQESVRRVLSEVKAVMSKLKTLKNAEENDINRMEQELNHMIVSS